MNDTAALGAYERKIWKNGTWVSSHEGPNSICSLENARHGLKAPDAEPLRNENPV